MKRSLSLSLSAAALVAAVAFSFAPAADQPEMPATAAAEDEIAGLPGGIGRGVARQLDLTAEQRHALKGVMRMHQPVLRPLMEQARTERAALQALIAAPTLDEIALAAQADRIAATHKQVVIASAHLRADLRKILNADQIAKLAAWRTHAKERAGHGRARFREWLLKP
jgi:Spy/CpxP family protein refolding chaperone